MGKYLPDFRRRFLPPFSGQFLGYVCADGSGTAPVKSVTIYQSTRRHVAENSNPYTQNYKELKSHVGCKLLSPQKVKFKL